VLQQHGTMEKQRSQPWAQLVPGLASTLEHLDSSVATLSATVQRTSLQQQEQRQQQQGAVAADTGATPAAGTTALSPSKRSTVPAIPKLYSDKVATVQEAFQEYWWVSSSCMVLVQVMHSCRLMLMPRHAVQHNHA
jgi:hypothetical protein